MRVALVLAACGGMLLAACGGTPQAARTRSRPVKATLVLPTPPDLLAGATPSASGTLWLLAGRPKARVLAELDLVTHKVKKVLPAPASAVAVAQLASGDLAVGLATSTTGAVSIVDPRSGREVANLPVSAPVRALALAPSKGTLDVLDASAKTAAVSVFNAATLHVVATVGVPRDAVAVAAAGTGALWTLGAQGTLQETAVRGDKVLTAFSLGSPAIAFCAAPDGGTLYVLKGTPALSNIAVVKTATEQVKRVLPAARHSRAIVLSLNNAALYDLVGDRAVGNLQSIHL